MTNWAKLWWNPPTTEAMLQPRTHYKLSKQYSKHCHFRFGYLVTMYICHFGLYMKVMKMIYPHCREIPTHHLYFHHFWTGFSPAAHPGLLRRRSRSPVWCATANRLAVAVPQYQNPQQNFSLSPEFPRPNQGKTVGNLSIRFLLVIWCTSNNLGPSKTWIFKTGSKKDSSAVLPRGFIPDSLGVIHCNPSLEGKGDNTREGDSIHHEKSSCHFDSNLSVFLSVWISKEYESENIYRCNTLEIDSISVVTKMLWWNPLETPGTNKYIDPTCHDCNWNHLHHPTIWPPHFPCFAELGARI